MAVTQRMPNSVVTHDANDYRVVVFGAAGVGKSSIVQQFIHGTYKEGYVPTVEDTYRKVSIILVSEYSVFLYLTVFGNDVDGFWLLGRCRL